MLYYYIVYKPYLVLSQFSPEGGKQTLANIVDVATDVYPVGRLDSDSEGLLILTNDKSVNHKLLSPAHQHEREYLVQVEGDVTQDALQQLEKGVRITVDGKMYQTQPCKTRKLFTDPKLPARNPGIRFRKNIPTTWMSITLHEGKNRQVRKMTAAVGFPTLRLVRYRIERLNIDGLQPGDLRQFTQAEFYAALRI